MQLKLTTAEDRALISEWIAKDPDHAGRCQPEFWLPEQGVECFTVSDDQGPVFFVRAENLLRLHIQFGADRKRTARVIDEFTNWIRADAKSKGYKQLIFDSVFAPLIRFLSKRGFRSSPAEQVMDL